jgi:hypothetical protein
MTRTEKIVELAFGAAALALLLLGVLAHGCR